MEAPWSEVVWGGLGDGGVVVWVGGGVWWGKPRGLVVLIVVERNSGVKCGWGGVRWSGMKGIRVWAGLGGVRWWGWL